MKKIKLLVTISFMAVFSACTSDAVENGNDNARLTDPIIIDPEPSDPNNPIVGALPTNVYTLKVFPDDGTGTGLLLNGVDVPLEVPANYAQVSNEVYIEGGDVYVVGAIYETIYPSGNRKAIVWKNGLIYKEYGTANAFGVVNAEAKSMVIHNGDMYVVGYDNTWLVNAALWKNDVETLLPSGGNAHCRATSIAVNNSYVCILGKKDNLPALWTNGSLGILPNLTTGTDIAISGNYAYIVGSQVVSGKTRARKLSKSLVTGAFSSNYLSANLTEGEATSITVDESNAIIYISGTELRPLTAGGGKRAVLWKNTNYTVLSEDGHAGDVSTFNGNVYVCGGQNNVALGMNQQIMKRLWVNGSEEYYDGFHSNTKSIALQ